MYKWRYNKYKYMYLYLRYMRVCVSVCMYVCAYKKLLKLSLRQLRFELLNDSKR